MKSALHACKVVLGLEPPESQVTEDELSCLLKYAGHAKTVVEIGTFEGKTTGLLAKHCAGKVYSIDPCFTGRLGISYGELIARMHWHKQGLRNIEFIKGFSYNIAPKFNESIDLLFIDADHTYDGIMRDWQDWVPKVRDGGIVAMHDSRPAPNSPQYLGSMKFYAEYVRNVPNIQQIDFVASLTVLRIKAGN
jgi:predicted O-methyltransferase YrrM